MIVGPVTVRSACSHHFCPIMGRLWIGVMPNQHSNLIGLSKYARLAEWIMGRPQIQEEAITQMAELLMDKVKPDGLAVVMEADHFCMHWRGVKDTNAKMINSVMRGSFLKDAALRREFLSLITMNKLRVRCSYVVFMPAVRPSPCQARLLDRNPRSVPAQQPRQGASRGCCVSPMTSSCR